MEDTSGSTKSLPTLVHRDLMGAEVGVEIELAASEVAHVRFARLRPGDSVNLADGKGTRWDAELQTIERRSVRCRLHRRYPEVAAPAVSLWLVEKAVELGVRAIRWIDWDRSRSVVDGARSEAFRSRAATRAEAALKQSGGAWAPEMFDTIGLEQALAIQRAPNETRWLGDAGGEPAFRVASRLLAAGASESPTLCVLVGPEGGITEEAARACRTAGFVGVSLARGTLRFETAAIGILSLAVAALEVRADRGDAI